ncbi:MAG TPA: hypothetical protein VLM38_22380 [Blastocatellia bacterium]|nr:hypothetical protein [Blastocatellia bacterium]
MRVSSEQLSQRKAANVGTLDTGFRHIDEERRLELKTRWRRQVAQCEGSLDSGARSEWFGAGDTDSADDTSGNKTPR